MPAPRRPQSDVSKAKGRPRPCTTLLSGPRLPRAADAQALPENEAAPPAKGRVAVGPPTRSRHRQRFSLEDRGRKAHKFPRLPKAQWPPSLTLATRRQPPQPPPS